MALNLGILSNKISMAHITGIEMTSGVIIGVFLSIMTAYNSSSISAANRWPQGTADRIDCLCTPLCSGDDCHNSFAGERAEKRYPKKINQ
jgi:hypothetical protein